MAKSFDLADVLVDRDWWNDTVAKLLAPHPAGQGALHRVRGPLIEQGIHGIWLGEAPSNLLYVKDKSRPVLVKVFIPWDQIRALVIIAAPDAKKLGFAISDPSSVTTP